MSTNQDNPTSITEATSNVSSETATGTRASPQETTAAAPSSAAGEVPPQDAKADASGQRKTKAGKKPRHPKANDHSERSHRKSAGSENVAGLPPDMRERLLARFVVPSVPLDRNLLPEALLGPLDAAGLGRADLLPSSAFMTMASIAAVAGPHLTFAECADPKLGEKLGTGTSLRIVMVGDQHAGPIMPGAIMAAVYAVENNLVAAHEQSVERIASSRRVAAERRHLHDQAVRAAAVRTAAPKCEPCRHASSAR